MAKFEVYKNPEGAGYLLDVQADLLSHLNTRLVVPLLPLSEAPTPAKILNPTFEILGEKVSLVTQFMAAVPCSLMREKIGSLSACRDEITAAIDLLITGF